MASKFSEQERAVLQECKRKMIFEGLSWGLPSVLIVWGAVRAKLLSRRSLAPIGAAGLVLFSFLGSMSGGSGCIEKILEMEDSQLAKEVRKSLPHQAARYDRQKRLRKAEKKDVSQTPGVDDDVPATSADRMASSGRSWPSYRESSSRDARHRESSYTMPQQEKPLRRNKYGDPVYDDDDYK